MEPCPFCESTEAACCQEYADDCERALAEQSQGDLSDDKIEEVIRLFYGEDQ